MAVGDKLANLKWEDHLRAIRRATPVDTSEDTFAKEARKAALLTDVEDFSEYYFPHYCQSEFGPFHKKQLKAVWDNERGIFVWIMARAHAKSVVHGILHPIFLMLNGQLRTMVLTSWNQGNAEFLLSDLRAELEANQRLIADFGPFQGAAQWEAGEFITRDGVYFGALGSGQSPRGLRNGECRPDYVLADDFDEDQQSRNPKRVNEAEDWLFGALFGAMDIKGRGRFVMVGNRIAVDTVIDRATKRADFTMQVDILDKKGNPSWPQRFTKKEVEYMIEKMGYRLSQREYFNNPITEGTTFKKDWLQHKKMLPLKQYRCLVAYLDPGFKKTATSDTKAWILVGAINGEFHVIRAFVGVASISEMIAWGYELQAYVNTGHGAVQMWMEEVFLQSLLYKDFAAEAKERNAPLPLRGDTRKKPDKDARIEAISGHFERGNVWFNVDYEDEHNMQTLKQQLLNFQPGVKTHKDGPDALEGGIYILNATTVAAGDITVGQRYKSKHRI